ncbi:MAG: lipopolysaccharide biosynthesis protein [Gemmataceae bacterium]
MIRTNYRSLLLNGLGNSSAFAVSLVVSLVLAPIVLHAIGDARYGAWSFTESFIAYLTLFDFGIAAALVRFTPRCLTQNDDAQLNRFYSASLTVFLFGGVLSAVLGFAFEMLFLDRCLRSPDLSWEFRWLFRLLVCNFAFSLSMSAYSAMLDGLGRFALKGGVRTALLVARVPLTLAAIRQDNPLLALGVVLTACTVLECIVLALATMYLIPTLKYRPFSVDRATLRQVAGYSRHAFTAMIAGRLSFHTDAFVIAPILGPAAITVFSIPSRLVELSKALLRSATTPLTATFSALEARDDRTSLRATFMTASRMAWYAALPLEAGLLLLGYPFLSIWVGPHYAELCMPLLIVLAWPLSLTISQSVASRVLYGGGDLRNFARATMAEGLSNLVLSIALIFPAGIVGVALGTALPHAIFCIWVINYVCRKLNVGAREYLMAVIKPALAVTIPVTVWAGLARRGIDSWFTLFNAGAAGLGAYAVAVAILELATIRRIRMRPGKSLLSLSDLRPSG